MDIRIEEIAFSTSEYCIPLGTLAVRNQTPEEKYLSGIGQKIISIAPPDEDIVTLSYKASIQIINETNKEDIKFIFFATESSFDNSKSAGIYLHELLGLPEDCRVIELKQACYAGTAALSLAKNFLSLCENKNAKCLVITSDIAKYEPLSNAEPTQGTAAVAILLSKNSDKYFASLGKFGGVITKNVEDFSKPNYLKYPFVNGKLSIVTYIAFLKKSITKFEKETGITPENFDAICYHTPFPKIAFKANDYILKTSPNNLKKHNFKDISAQIKYNSVIGNVYTASLYLSLISLLENSKESLHNKNIGMFSYGSGSTAEFFTLTLSDSYEMKLHQEYHANIIKSRKEISYESYLNFHNFEYTNEITLPKYTKSSIRLAAIKNNIRNYEFL